MKKQYYFIPGIFPNLEKNESLTPTESINKYCDDWGSHFEIALPGIKKEELSVKIENKKVLTIKVNRKEEDRQYEYKTITIPNDLSIYVDPQKFDISGLKVKLESGMLYVAVPLREDEKPSSVDVTVE